MLGKEVNFYDYKHINRNDKLNYYSSTCDVRVHLHVRQQLNLSFEEEHIHKHTDKETQMCLTEES